MSLLRGGERRGAYRRTLLGIAWVDDVTSFRWVRPQPRCAGLAGVCAVCQIGLVEVKALDEFWVELDEFWVELCDSFGVQLNLIKRQWCEQSV